MDRLRAVLLSQADGHDFKQPALVFSAEAGMGLDAVYDNDAVGLFGVFVYVDRRAVGQIADIFGFHGRPDGGAHGFFRDTVLSEDFSLSLGHSAAVASHGRNQKGLSTQGFDELDGLPEHDIHALDPAAAGRDGDGHARFYGADDLGPVQRLPDRRGDIGDGVVGQLLADPGHFRDFLFR